ncbi:MAG TPA: hypothetical protein VK509_19565 [Polyangiales bacterium]|nr:hypothetical protein [Polyangiales bacterium]
MIPSAIDEIEERLQDLSDALRQGGYHDLAQRFELHALDFTDQARVRRAVNAIATQLEGWRLDPSQAPESAKVSVAGNRLEDACRQALTSGVIAAAPPSVGSRVRRKLAIALFAAFIGALLLLIPTLLIHAGIDFSDLRQERTLPVVKLPRGEELEMPVQLLQAALEPRAVSAVRIAPRKACAEPFADGSSCNQVDARLWPPGRLETFELKLPHQAYGLLFSFDRVQLPAAGVGEGRLWLAATDDTPEGRYELQLEGAYEGYTPQKCELLDRLQNACPQPRTGKGERHAQLSLPMLVVEVVRGDPARRLGEKRLADAEAAERKRKGEERARQIEAVLGEIQVAIKDTEKLFARKRWEEARERLQKLNQLFEPLDELMRGAPDAVPADVSQARARLDTMQEQLQAFEARVFEQAFDAVTSEANSKTPEDRLFARVASQNRISPAYVAEVYTGRADEIQRRLDARAQAHVDALKAEQAARERRCGALPKGAWAEIKEYARTALAQPHVELVLGECMTPRLTERDCWEIRCDYERREEIAVERPRVVTKHAANFYVVQQRVTGHR